MAGVASRLCQGAGWRFGWNGEQGLLGGEDWALELTATEWQEWCRTCRELWETWQTMQAHLMDEEDLTLERQSQFLMVILTGSRGNPTLYLRLLTGRVAEGQWRGEAAHTLLARIGGLNGTGVS